MTTDLEIVRKGERIWFTSSKIIKFAERYLEEMGHSPLSYEILHGSEIHLKEPL